MRLLSGVSAAVNTRRALASALAAAFCLHALPAVAEPDEHLHLVRQPRNVYVVRDVVRPAWHGRHEWHRDWRSRDVYRQVIPEGVAYEVYITQGDVPLSEASFLDLIEASGVAPVFVRRVRAREAAAGWDGLVASVGWIGALVAGSIFAEHGGPLVNVKSNEVDVDVTGVTAVALGGVALVSTVLWLGNASSKDPPYFREFTEAEAIALIDAYNRRWDAMHPATPPSPSGVLRVQPNP
ncbi:MAG TPA: hypothetical protein V6D47_11135 [Oscillatoriaceae cyanobacterium]